MRLSVPATLAFSGLLTFAAAQPFGWAPGSTVIDGADVSDRVVIINLADGTIESDIPSNTSAPAWQYTTDSPEKDAFIPSFSPDGKFIYLINGGKSDLATPNRTDGHIRVYDALDVVSMFRAGTTPTEADMIQEVVIPADDLEDAVEPMCFTIDGDIPYCFFIDVSFEHLFTYMRDETTGELTLLNTVDTQEDPTPLWISPANDFAFFCAVNDDDPVVNIVDILTTPGEIARTISVPLPAQDKNTFAFASCAFPLDSSTTQTNTLVQPPVSPIDLPLNELWIFSGYTGIPITGIPPFIPAQNLEDPCNIYKLDISSGEPIVMELTNGGAPEYVIDPDGDYVVFPPVIQMNDNGNGIYAQVGGTTVIDPDGDVDTLFLPSGDEAWFPNIGHMMQEENNIYIGSASESAVGIPLTYAPTQLTSAVYRYSFPPISKVDVTLTKVMDIDRSVSFVVGQTDERLVVGASDTFLVDLTSDIPPAEQIRDTLFYLIDTDAPNPAATAIIVDCELIAGAYGQQPFAQLPGDGPEIEVTYNAADVPDGSSLNIGSNPVGSPVEATFTVSNTGTEDLNLGTISAGPEVTVTEPLAALIAPAGSDTFTVEVLAPGGGQFNYPIFFTTDDADENPFNVVLQVTALAPEADLLNGANPVASGTGTVDFGTVQVGAAAPSVTLTLENNGDTTLTTSAFDAPSGVNVTEPLATAIADGASDTFTLEMVTTAEMTLNATVSFNNNDEDENPYTFSVTGSVVPAGGNQAPTDIALDGDEAGEAAEQGTVIGTLTTTDPDVGDTFTYTIENATKGIQSAFAIDGDTLTVDDASQLDVTVQDSTDLTIRTTDSGSLFFEKVFTITITPNVLMGTPGEPVRFAGDTNGDAFVNANDFTITRNTFFNDFTCRDYRATGDANGDGFVNANDFTITRNNFFADYLDLTYSEDLVTETCP